MPIRLTLTGMAHGGEAVSRHEGKVIFVPYGIPSEEVSVEITEDKGRYARGQIVEIHKASPHRVEAPCPYFGTCGGCQWQHIAYPEQVRLKEQILREQLQRIGSIADPPLEPDAAAENPWAYRNHAQLHADREGRLGYFAARSHEVVPIDECLIMHPLAAEVFEELILELSGLERLSIRVGTASGDKMVIIETKGGELPSLEVDIPVSLVHLSPEGVPLVLLGEDHITEEITGRWFRISAPSFFQVNSQQLTRLAETVAEYSGLTGKETVVDAYSGVGTLGLILALRAKKVILVEENPFAAADARANVQSLPNVQVIAGTVEKILPQTGKPVDIALLDPPRQGLSKEATRALIALRPSRIVYVSCDPATLARDIKHLGQSGYRLERLRLVDMFPQTYHIEAVALLGR